MSTDVRNDAVAAPVVATKQNRDKTAECVRRILCRRVGMGVEPFGNLVLVRQFQPLGSGAQMRISLGLKVGNYLRNHAKTARTDSKIEFWELFEHFRPKALHRATHQTDDTRAILHRAKVAALAYSLLFGLLPDSA